MAWCVLLLVLYIQGHAPKGTLTPSISEFYYAFEAAFLPAIAFLQWRLGCIALQHHKARSTELVSNALFLSASCFVVPDALLLLAARPDLLSLWARAAGPLALLAAIGVLRRGELSWRDTLLTTLALALPALLFVR